jgi:predicted CoA-binding protein
VTQSADAVVCALPDRSSAAEISRYQDALVISEILHTARTIAIVGLSSNILRPSNFVGFYLQRHGYRISPVNPNEREAVGEKAIAEEAVQIGAGALWMQFGVISGEGARIAERAGLKVVMDRCMKVEHARHMGRMHWLGFNTGVVGSRRGAIE